MDAEPDAEKDHYAEFLRRTKGPPDPPEGSAEEVEEGWGSFLRRLGLLFLVSLAAVLFFTSDTPEARDSRRMWFGVCTAESEQNVCRQMAGHRRQVHPLSVVRRTASEQDLARLIEADSPSKLPRAPLYRDDVLVAPH